jgi:hypothetical protein
MNVHPRILVPAAAAVAVVAAAAVAGVLVAHGQGDSAATSSNHRVALTAAGSDRKAAGNAVGESPQQRCEQGETPMGYVGVDQSGGSAAARITSGTGALTQIADSATGQVLTLTRSPAAIPAAERPRDSGASAWLPVYPQATASNLRSCEITLADRPAAQPIIESAMTAFVRAGYFASLPKLKTQLQASLISDDPATSGSVIVTILVEGPVRQITAPPGVKIGPHPPLHSLIAYTALEVATSAHVVGVASGGF